MYPWVSYVPFQLSSSCPAVKEPSFLCFSPSLLSDYCVFTVAIRGSGIDHLIGLPLQTTPCCKSPPGILYLPPPLVLFLLSTEDLLFAFCCSILTFDSSELHASFFSSIPLFSKSRSSGPSLWELLLAVVNPDSPLWMCRLRSLRMADLMDE